MQGSFQVLRELRRRVVRSAELHRVVQRLRPGKARNEGFHGTHVFRQPGRHSHRHGRRRMRYSRSHGSLTRQWQRRNLLGQAVNPSAHRSRALTDPRKLCQ
eukprot:TRINITY_DN3807_c0_g2_i2.p4 TRINITY_DN3807_c0_g2~~TRINITY_DN3807_c0_g2_i2.p4  ORF type:complete len:101 (+),score=7.66 TRINITY_DN3807_c0_g2_i2:478-780(+)